MKSLPVKTWIEPIEVNPNHVKQAQPNDFYAYHKTNNIMQKQI